MRSRNVLSDVGLGAIAHESLKTFESNHGSVQIATRPQSITIDACEMRVASTTGTLPQSARGEVLASGPATA